LTKQSWRKSSAEFKACDNGLKLLEGVRDYIKYYNQKKHQYIKKKPNDVYQESICKIAA